MTFLAVPNLLLSAAVQAAGGSDFKRVTALQRCLLQHLDELQEGATRRHGRRSATRTDTFGLAALPGGRAPAPARTETTARRK